MPTPELRAWRIDITREVNRLRRQFLFLFILLLAAAVLFGLKMFSTTNQIQTIVDQIREDRFTACQTRTEQLTVYNGHVEVSLLHIMQAVDPTMDAATKDRLRVQLGLDLQFPLPNCPPDPSP